MRISLTIMVILAAWIIWFGVGYWAIERNKQSWAFGGIFLPVCGFVGLGAITLIEIIWSGS